MSPQEPSHVGFSKLNDKECQMQVDTGASVSLIGTSKIMDLSS